MAEGVGKALNRSGLPLSWCERCWTHHEPGDHDERAAGRKYRSPAGRSSGGSLGGSRRGPGEWLGDVFEAVFDFLFGWLSD